MVAQWMILASVVLLALGVTAQQGGEDKEQDKEQEQDQEQLSEHQHDAVVQQMHQFQQQNQQQIPLAVECCKTASVLPSVVKKLKLACLKHGLSLIKTRENTKKVKKSCELIKCMVIAQKLVDNDNYKHHHIDEQKWRDAFSSTAAAGTETIVQAALDRCFVRYKPYQGTDRKSSVCEGEMGVETVLFSCIASDILMNCPKSMWHTLLKPKCREAINNEKSV